MLDSTLLTVATGTVLGFLSGLGIGGGSLLILWLTLVQGISQEIARGINLMFFIPSAAVAILLRIRNKSLNWKVILPALLAGIIGAILLGMLAAEMDTQLLRKPFGILLLVTGLREIFYKPRK